jgi:hypothetical protein
MPRRYCAASATCTTSTALAAARSAIVRASLSARSCGLAACLHGGRAFAGGRLQQFRRAERRHFDVQVDAIEQRPAQLALVTRDLLRRAAAGPLRSEPAAGTRIHRGHQLEARGKFGPARGAGNGDAARLQGLAQGFEGRAREFRQFIEEQDAMVGQRNLARPRRRAATDQRHRAGGVMRGTGRPQRPLRQREATGKAGDRGAFERFRHAHGRQQPGKALRQHGFARTRRADEQQRMAARRGDLQGAACASLALDVGEVGIVRTGDGRIARQAYPAIVVGLRRLGLRLELRDHVQQMPRANHMGARDQCGLLRACRRQHQPRRTVRRMQGKAGGQGATHRPQLA